MRSKASHRTILALVLALAAAPFLLAQPAPAARQTFRGKVVPLAKLLEKQGVKLDPEAAPHWLALVTNEGKIHPLVRDDGARMFFKDKALLDRPMVITGQIVPGTNLLQVFDVRSEKAGKLHEVYYWCDICAIRRSEKMICECCGGPMDLREPPVN